MAKQASRPHMPGYGIQPESEGAGLMDWREVERQLVEARNYWIASVSSEGQPHSVPVWGLWHQGGFFFGTGVDSQKDRNLKANPAVVVHLESGDEVVILEGGAYIEGHAKILAELDARYQAKYEVELAPPASIYGVRLRKAYAWREADFPTTATRWIFPED